MWPASCSTRRRIARATRNFPVPVSEALSERSTLDGEDSLLDLMREEPAISREYGLRQEILAVRRDAFSPAVIPGSMPATIIA